MNIMAAAQFVKVAIRNPAPDTLLVVTEFVPPHLGAPHAVPHMTTDMHKASLPAAEHIAGPRLMARAHHVHGEDTRLS